MDFFECPNFYAIVLEYVQGKELYEILANDFKSLTDLNKKKIFRQLADACSYLHENQIAHRDIKSENVLVDANYKVVLIDFGFSVIIDPQNPLFTDHCGSSQYAAPEMILQIPYDPRISDIWALGVILFTLITGELPFNFGGSKTERKMFYQIAKGDYQLPGPVNQYDPAALSLLKSILRTKPEMRASIQIILDSEWIENA